MILTPGMVGITFHVINLALFLFVKEEIIHLLFYFPCNESPESFVMLDILCNSILKLKLIKKYKISGSIY